MGNVLPEFGYFAVGMFTSSISLFLVAGPDFDIESPKKPLWILLKWVFFWALIISIGFFLVDVVYFLKSASWLVYIILAAVLIPSIAFFVFENDESKGSVQFLFEKEDAQVDLENNASSATEETEGCFGWILSQLAYVLGFVILLAIGIGLLMLVHNVGILIYHSASLFMDQMSFYETQSFKVFVSTWGETKASVPTAYKIGFMLFPGIMVILSA